MVAISPGLAINSSDPSQRTPPSSFRYILATLFRQVTPGRPVAGVIAAQTNARPLSVTGSLTTMSYNVSAGYAITTRTGEGAYIVGTPVDVTVETAPGHASLRRYDVLYIVQPDYEKSEVGSARIDVAQGAPSSNPQVPSIPEGALELRRALVTAGATTTAALTYTNAAPTTTLNIGSVSAAQISDPENISVTKIGGKRITVSNTAPSQPSIGDVWIDTSS